jgi:hypothetical protein
MIEILKYKFEQSSNNPYIEILNIKELPSDCIVDIELNQLS